MELKAAKLSRDLRSGLYFSAATIAAWLLFFQGAGGCGRASSELRFLFSLAASGTAYVMLRELGYFHSRRLRPRKSDVFLVLAAIPLAAVLQNRLFGWLFEVQLCSDQHLVVWSPLLALLVFGSEYCSARGGFDGRQRKIVIDLLPIERVRLLADFAALDLDRNVEFLSRNDLRKYLLSGREREIALIVISRAAVGGFDADGTLVRAHLAGIPVMDCRSVSADLTGRVSLSDSDQWSYILEATRQTQLLRAFYRLKTLLEPVLALCLLVLLAPLFAVIAVAVKMSSKGPVFYLQTRTGCHGRAFTLVKFRSMHLNAEPNGPRWCLQDDARITPFGRVLRKTRLDELPQLWNVVKGEMSFCGPRPERPEMYVQLKKDIPLFSLRTLVRPGITGWAQVCAGYAASVEESMLKLEYDLYYIKYMSPRLDLIVLLKTLGVLVRGLRRTPAGEGADRSALPVQHEILRPNKEAVLPSQVM